MSAERTAELIRTPSEIDGVFGSWRSDSGWKCVTVELPWVDADGNGISDANTSCINPGRYLCTWRWSEKHKCNLYHIEGVPGRTDCEIHAANLAEQLLGCIAPGGTVAQFAKDSIRQGVPKITCLGVTSSGATLAALEADMRKDGVQQSFWLTIA